MANTKVNGNALGLSFGVVSGFAVLLMSVFAMNNYGVEMVQLIGTVYPGYDASIKGAALGLVYGFLDGYIGGLIIAWLYNKFNK